jgi:hypothetical protein
MPTTSLGAMTSGSPERRRRGPWSRVPWLWAAAAALLATAVWVVAALLMAGRGFDVTDEGFYVLSYRWWDSTPRVFTGVQYLYGPVFELLGWSIPGLRVVRLVSVVLVHLTFGWAFMSWLRTRRPEAPASRGWELAGALTVLASAGVIYGWLPLSPGYNDVVLLMSLLLVSLLLWSMRVVSRGARLPVLAAACAGPPVVALVLAKWASAGLILMFLLVLGVVALRSLGARGWLPYVASAVASVAGCVLLVNAFVQPLRPLASEMTEVNRLVAASTNSPLTLLGMYVRSTLSMGAEALLLAALALLVAGLGVLLRRTRFAAAGLPVAVLGPVAALIAASPQSWGLPGGGVFAIRTYVVPLVALALVVVAARWVGLRTGRPADRGVAIERPGRAADVAVVTMLVLLPAVQALGTGNPLAFLAVNGFSCWVALMVAACTMPGPRPVARGLTISATACAVLVAATTGADGLLRHPYRTAAWSEATTAVGGTGPLATVRVDASTASQWRAIRDAVGAHRPGHQVMAFDEMAGTVVLLDGRSVGEAWYSRIDPDRTAAGIRSVCERPQPLTETLPVIVYDRAPRAVDEDALRACGLSLSRDYRLVTIDQGEPRLRVYVPISAEERSRP